MYPLKRKHAMTRPGPQPDEYLLGHSANEEERLRRQPRELALDSKRLLDQVDIRPGDQAIDIGCGPQGILDLLSERVGPKGKVVGLDGVNRPFGWHGNSSRNVSYGTWKCWRQMQNQPVCQERRLMWFTPALFWSMCPSRSAWWKR